VAIDLGGQQLAGACPGRDPPHHAVERDLDLGAARQQALTQQQIHAVGHRHQARGHHPEQRLEEVERGGRRGRRQLEVARP